MRRRFSLFGLGPDLFLFAMFIGAWCMSSLSPTLVILHERYGFSWAYLDGGPQAMVMRMAAAEFVACTALLCLLWLYRPLAPKIISTGIILLGLALGVQAFGMSRLLYYNHSPLMIIIAIMAVYGCLIALSVLAHAQLWVSRMLREQRANNKRSAKSS